MTNHQVSIINIITAKNVIKIMMFWFILSFLTVRHGIHVSLYGLFAILLYEFFKARSPINLTINSILILTSLSSIFIATLIQQAVSGNVNFSAFDGPSKLLVAGCVFLFLQKLKIDFLEIIGMALPLSLIILVIYLQNHPEYFWGHRWANVFVDPNSLGSQASILAMICLALIQRSESNFLIAIKLLGMACGFYISLKAQSRGGWISIPILGFCWAFMQQKNNHIDRKYFYWLLGALLIGSVIGFYFFSLTQLITDRTLQAIQETTTWLKDPSIFSSSGARLSMWVISFQLIGENWIGYGEVAIKEIAANHPLNFGVHSFGMNTLILAGPHSDILSKGLSLGFIGISAYLATIFIPFRLFLQKIQSINKNMRQTAQIGLLYVIGIFICGLFNEMISLKYLCSFYGLMIACLANQVLQEN